MFYRILVCIPIVFRLTIIMLVVFFIFSVIGVEIFSTIGMNDVLKNKYSKGDCSILETKVLADCEYANFNDLLLANLLLLQVSLSSGWSY
jgi:two pore calcium channel protein 3